MFVETEESGSFIVIIDGVLWLDLNGFVMTLNGLLELFKLVVCSTEVPMIGRNLRVDINCLYSESDLFLEVPKFTHGLAL